MLRMKTHDSAEVIALTPTYSAVREVRVTTTTEHRVKKSIGGREGKALTPTSGPSSANGRMFGVKPVFLSGRADGDVE